MNLQSCSLCATGYDYDYQGCTGACDSLTVKPMKLTLPTTQAEAIAAFPCLAADLEWHSWLVRLREDRDAVCPARPIAPWGAPHVVASSIKPPPGYYGVCVMCGHCISLPF